MTKEEKKINVGNATYKFARSVDRVVSLTASLTTAHANGDGLQYLLDLEYLEDNVEALYKNYKDLYKLVDGE